jgi:hypothetical protein
MQTKNTNSLSHYMSISQNKWNEYIIKLNNKIVTLNLLELSLNKFGKK